MKKKPDNRGKHPNSLKNLRPGFTTSEAAEAARIKGLAVRRENRRQQELLLAAIQLLYHPLQAVPLLQSGRSHHALQAVRKN